MNLCSFAVVFDFLSSKDKSLEDIELTDTFDVSLSWHFLVVVSIVEKYPCNLGPINLAFRIWGPG